MSDKARWFAGIALGAIILTAFFTGRTIEEGALAAKKQSSSRGSVPAPTATEAPALSHQQLAVAEIFALPFADFYEALRAAPGEAREKWARELRAMPEGPRRRAAVSGFYKLLVQFDPAAAVKAIGEIGDIRLQKLALDAAVDATPGFAFPLVAELCRSLQDRITGKRDHLADVMVDWAAVDAPAAARFIDDHMEAFESLSHQGRSLTVEQFVSTWAAVDPKTTREWIERKESWNYRPQVQESFVEGWYENDRATAISFTLTHVDDENMSGAIGAILRDLYYDSRDEAAKFIQSLPENKRPDAFKEAFRNLILLKEEDTGEASLTPRAIASWMVEFPPAYWQDVLGHLFRYDEKGADDMLVWIQQLPPGVREAAAAEYSPPFGKSGSERIMPMLQVVDPVLRDQLFKATLDQTPDFEEATTAVNEAPLSIEQKQHFLQIIAAVKAEKDRKAAEDEEAAREQPTPDAGDQGSEN